MRYNNRLNMGFNKHKNIIGIMGTAWAMIILNIVIIFAVLGLMGWGITHLVGVVRETGVKGLVEDIWYGDSQTNNVTE